MRKTGNGAKSPPCDRCGPLCKRRQNVVALRALLVPQRLDRIEPRRPLWRVEAEEHADQRAEAHGGGDHQIGATTNRRLDVVNLICILINSFLIILRKQAGRLGGPMAVGSTRSDARNPVFAAHRVPAHLARRFHQICLGAMAEVTVPAGLSPGEYGILAALIDWAGLDQRRLAERLGIDPASAGQMIDRLETAGLVERRVHPDDRRARLLSATRSGERLRRQLRPSASAAQERLLAPLSVREGRLFLDFLTRLVEGKETYARPGNGRRPPRRAPSRKDAVPKATHLSSRSKRAAKEREPTNVT
jgi:DNA-binding MarR family transcriptional regulator